VLSYPMMGALALAIVWVNALLVAAAAWKELGPIGSWRRAAERGMLRGEVVSGRGPGGAIAVRRIEQVGRATDAGEVIFADRRHACEVYGGTVRLEDGREIDVAATPAAVASPLNLGDGVVEVWPDDAAHEAASACPSTEVFSAALEAARKARGFARTVEAAIGPGADVRLLVGDDGTTVRLVSAVEPARWAAKKRGLVVAFIAAELAAAGLATAIALVPPAFGLVSKLGGALCLAYFLGVQPIGTAVRDAVRSPARRALRGRWAQASSADPSRVQAAS
jgi:hypothetical protein